MKLENIQFEEQLTKIMSQFDPSVEIEENLRLTGSETVGVIIAIVTGASILIIMVLISSLACRFWFQRHNRRGQLIPRTDNRSLRRHPILRSTSSTSEQQKVERYRLQQNAYTSNTFQSLSGQPPLQDGETTFSHDQVDNGRLPPPNVVEEPHPPQPQEFPRDDLMLTEKLGEGEYGPIYRGESYGLESKEKLTPVTVKMLSPQEETANKMIFDQDVEMLASINHLNVVGLLGVCTRDSPECILLDAGMPGDLLTHIREMKKSISPYVATEAETIDLLRIADEISLGMSYLASERFIHKDLSLRNCIIGYTGIVKIAHFGLGPIIYPEAYYRVNETDLPIRWMPPEAITSANFTTMSDTWSFGVCVWELFTYGVLPFESETDEAVIDFILRNGRLQKPSKCSKSVFDMILTCWNIDPCDRPNFYDLHEIIIDLGGIQSPLSALGPATPISPLSPMTPTGIGNGPDNVPSTFQTDTNYRTS